MFSIILLVILPSNLGDNTVSPVFIFKLLFCITDVQIVIFRLSQFESGFSHTIHCKVAKLHSTDELLHLQGIKLVVLKWL